MTIEDLFDAEFKMRVAARAFWEAESHPLGTLEKRRERSRELRAAARSYSKVADAFESALADSLVAKSTGCHHLAESDTPADNLMPDRCPNCQRFYVNDDNSVEPERAL